MRPRVLVVEDDAIMRRWLAESLREADCDAALYPDGDALFAGWELERAHVLLLDLMLPGLSGLEVLQRVRSAFPGLSVIVLTAEDSVQTAVDCMRLGAVDYLQKPLDALRLATAVRNACEQFLLRERLRAAAEREREDHGFERILGESEPLRRAVAFLRRGATSDLSVHLHGEPGTGKRLFARVLHAESARGNGPFVAVRCGPGAGTELFGEGPGGSGSPGALRRARGGTLFLDEVTDLSSELQQRLSEAMTEPSGVGVRLVLSSRRDPEECVRSGELHEELHLIGSSFSVRLPPLRERGEDVLRLARAFVVRAAEVQGRLAPELDEDARSALLRWCWPGNVRELDGCMRRALLLGDGAKIGFQHLSDEIVLAFAPVRAEGNGTAAGEERIRTLEQVEKQAVLEALRITGWNIQLAAERLCIARATLYRRLHAWGLTRPQAGLQSPPPIVQPARPRLF